MRFLGVGLEDAVPDATTVWLFREALAKAGLVKALFDRFNRRLDAKGYIARGGQIVDATIVTRLMVADLTNGGQIPSTDDAIGRLPAGPLPLRGVHLKRRRGRTRFERFELLP